MGWLGRLLAVQDRAGRLWAAAGWLAALPVLLLPISDPDLWWHLSSGRWMAEHLLWPRAEWLSFTLQGQPWADFEWLGQLVFHGAFSLGGLGALWALKTALLGLACWLVWRLLQGLPAPARAAGLAFWAACMIPRSDLRIELFSCIAFLALLLALERVRTGPEIKIQRAAATAAAVFALWANLHSGFAAGLLLLGLYAAGETPALLRKEGEARKRALLFSFSLITGALGALLNPYGIGVYSILWEHAAQSAAVSTAIVEWGPLDFARDTHRPALLLCALAAIALALGLKRRRLPAAWGLSLAVFGALCLRHSRFIPYFAAAAVPFALRLLLFKTSPPEEPRRLEPACAVAVALCALFSASIAGRVGVLRRTFDPRYTPVQAAAFLEKHPALLERRLYEPWGWGGYLGFRLPSLRVFQDGRYLFHPLLAEAGAGMRSPSLWAEFLGRRGIELALMENLPLRVATTRKYPDGSTREFQRPFYFAYFPREEWALLHFDEKALLFARRKAFEPAWLEGLEYRLLRPGDEEALADALARREVDAGRLAAEIARHAALGRELARASLLPARHDGNRAIHVDSRGLLAPGGDLK